MANLSNLLGNLYGGDDDEPEGSDDTAPTPPRTDPEWASDDRLDEAFGDWTAGEMPGMQRDERESLEEGTHDDTGAESDEPQATLAPEEPVVSAGELAEVTEVERSPTADDMPWPDNGPVDEPADAERWALHHDDVLPEGGGGLLARLRGR